MSKLKYAIPSLLAVSSAFAQESTPVVNLSAAESAAGSLQTAVTGLFTNSIIPMVLAIAGISFSAWIIIKIFGWAKRPTGR